MLILCLSHKTTKPNTHTTIAYSLGRYLEHLLESISQREHYTDTATKHVADGFKTIKIHGEIHIQIYSVGSRILGEKAVYLASGSDLSAHIDDIKLLEHTALFVELYE